MIDFSLLSLCPISGLEITCLGSSRPETEIAPGIAYTTFFKIGEAIILSQPHGYTTLADNRRHMAKFDEVIKPFTQQNIPFTLMEDYGDHTGAAFSAKASYVNYVIKLKNLTVLTFFNVSPFFKLTINLAKRLNRTPFDVAIANNYEDGIRNHSLSLNKNLAQKYSRINNSLSSSSEINSLISFMGTINWEKPGVGDMHSYIPQSNDLRPLYESIALIKHDFDTVLIEKERAENRLEQENRINMLRADIWRIASARHIDPRAFIQQLISKAGSTLNIDRIIYWRYGSDTISGKFFSAQAQWHKEGLPDKEGLQVLAEAILPLISEDAFYVNEATVRMAMVRAHKEHLIDCLAKLSQELNTRTAFLFPYRPGSYLAGYFSFEWVSSEGPSLDQYDSITRIGQEMSAIVGSFSAQFEAEKALQKAYEEMEERVQNRTVELTDANEKLIQARIAAETANAAKSRFLANISHEIRTPLNAVIGFAHMIPATTDLAEHTRFATTIHSESKRLLELINQLLDLSKIEAGKMELDLHPFTLSEMFQELERTFGLIASQRGISFCIESSPLTPQHLIGDTIKLRQVLINLVGNALKFTSKGNITVLATPVSVVNQHCRIRFAITDTGTGIPEDKLNRLFKAFEQVDSSITRKYGGTGLGTAISRQLVELMHGTIDVESVEGKGSTFWFEIPFERCTVDTETEESLQHHACPLLHDQPILIVDDYPPNLELATFFLAQTGAAITTATNGCMALDYAQKQQFKLILMDVQMPEMDGISATRALRALPAGKNLPIIGMTAFAYQDDREQCLAAGMNAVLIKPVDWDRAYSVISSLLTHKKPDETNPLQNQSAVSQDVTLVLDLKAYVHRMKDNQKIAYSIIDGFIKLLPGDLLKLQQQLASETSGVVAERIAHSIKGAALNICADPLANAAKELELLLKSGTKEGTDILYATLLKCAQEMMAYYADQKPD